MLGYKSLVEGLVRQMKEDMAVQTGSSQDEIKVVATGGLNSVLKPLTDIFQDVDKALTLCGLHRIAVILRDKLPQKGVS